MKPWAAERTVRALPFFLIASGTLAVGLGAFLAYCTAEVGVVDPRDLSMVAVGTSFLIQSAGVLSYLRLRGKRGMRRLLVTSFLSLVPPLVLFAVASMEFGWEFGAYTFLLMGLPLCSATLTHLLVTRRIEPGDGSPLLMPAAEQRGMPALGGGRGHFSALCGCVSPFRFHLLTKSPPRTCKEFPSLPQLAEWRVLNARLHQPGLEWGVATLGM